MSCYGCLINFSLFTREHSCPNCGFSYCSKCLKQKVSLGELQKNVCKNCYKKLSSNFGLMASSDTDIPDLLVKRLEALENPAKPPITVFRHSNRLMNLKSGLSSQDQEILERLERLKAQRTTTLPDESEIIRRLALLQDRSEESINEKQKPHKFDSKTEQQQVDDLLKQYMAESDLDTNFECLNQKGINEIREKLKKLQTSENNESAELYTSEMESDDSTAKIIQRAIAEGQLEKRLKRSDRLGDDNDDEDGSEISDSEENENESEFPWCIICNENATVKCFGCDGNLYCNVCFKQGHEFFNMEDHKYVAYTRKFSLS